MSDDGQTPAWGLWNATLHEWFNPGTARPWYPTREAAERAMPNARRQWPRGTWVVMPYPAAEDPSAASARS